MKPGKFIFILTLLLCGILFSGSLLAKKKAAFPEATEDGMQLLKGTKLAAVYADPGASLTNYKRIKLIEAGVAFRKNWERDQRRNNSISQRPLSPKEIESIKTDLATGFHKIFVEELKKAGYEMTDEIAEDVLIIRPAIINLDITAPDTAIASRSRTYAASAGEMTLYIELYDAVTGDLFAKAIDRKIDGQWGGYYTWTNSITNKVAAERIFKGWAKILTNALDESKKLDVTSH